jgi:hypothetical protein
MKSHAERESQINVKRGFSGSQKMSNFSADDDGDV